MLARLGECNQRLDRLEVPLGEQLAVATAAAEPAPGGRRLTLAVLPGQEPARERKEGDEGEVEPIQHILGLDRRILLVADATGSR